MNDNSTHEETADTPEDDQAQADSWIDRYFPLWKDLLPYLAVTVVVSCLATVAAQHIYAMRFKPETSMDFVVFDPIKYAAGQKYIASAFIGQDSAAQAEAATILNNVSRSTRDLIGSVANGRVVLVKQGVVGGTYEDITDKVMRSAGLPTENLPTIDTITQIAETDPTRLSASMIGEIKRIEEEFRRRNGMKITSGKKYAEDPLP